MRYRRHIEIFLCDRVHKTDDLITIEGNGLDCGILWKWRVSSCMKGSSTIYSFIFRYRFILVLVVVDSGKTGRNTLWMGLPVHCRASCTLTVTRSFTPRGNLVLLIYLLACSWEVEGKWRKFTQTWRDHKKTPHRQ